MFDLLYDPFTLHVRNGTRSVAHFSLSAFLQIRVISTESICQPTFCRTEVLDDVTNKFLCFIHCCMWQDDEVPDIPTVLALDCGTESMLFSDDPSDLAFLQRGRFENNATWKTTIMA